MPALRVLHRVGGEEPDGVDGTLLKREAYRYNIEPLRASLVAGLAIDTFDWLIERSIPFNRYLMNQLNERLGQFIAAREIDPYTAADRLLGRVLNSPNHQITKSPTS